MYAYAHICICKYTFLTVLSGWSRKEYIYSIFSLVNAFHILLMPSLNRVINMFSVSYRIFLVLL